MLVNPNMTLVKEPGTHVHPPKTPCFVNSHTSHLHGGIIGQQLSTDYKVQSLKISPLANSLRFVKFSDLKR
ncbi:unnamed protein product, partial [Iphiclides podalirius]